MSRRSTVAVSTFVPALKVLSTTFPVITFLRVVRTKAPPLPGLTCWNAVTAHSWPSRLSTKPFLRSLVVATCGSLLGRCGRAMASRELGVGLGTGGRRVLGTALEQAAPPCRRQG